MVDTKPLWLPDSVVSDPKLKDDPRIKKYKQRKQGGGSSSKPNDPRAMRKAESTPVKTEPTSPDSKLSRTSSAPPISEKTGMPTLPPLPGLENFMVPKPTDPRLSRQLSSGGSSSSSVNKGETSPSGHKEYKPLAHRSDPRFRKKAKSTETRDTHVEPESPPVSKENNKPDLDKLDPRSRVSVQRRNNLDYSSPLGGGGSPGSGSSPGYGGSPSYNSYNRGGGRTRNKTKSDTSKKPPTAKPPNPKPKQEETVKDIDKPTGSPGPMDPDMPVLTRILPEDIDKDLPEMPEPEPEEEQVSLKDTFKTLDPTASPFC